MNCKQNRSAALLIALTLFLILLTGCGGKTTESTPPPAPPSSEEKQESPSSLEEETPPPEESPLEEPAEEPAEVPEPENHPAAQDTDAGKPPETPESVPEPQPAPEAATLPGPVPQPEPVPEAEEAIADGNYTVNVTLSGGSGRATVGSPASLRCEGGKLYVTLIWSSPNFDYMKVDGQRYDQLNTEGNSTFEIPVAALDQPLNVIADTVAMSEPHEVEYTLQFDSASLKNA